MRSADLDPAAMIIGALSSRNDVIVEGRLCSDVSLHLRNMTIGRKGSVEADVHGASICVEGRVTGDLYGDEQVIVRRTGEVKGKITSPRVILEIGARFEGEIEMTPASSSVEPGSAGSSDLVVAPRSAAGRQPVRVRKGREQ